MENGEHGAVTTDASRCSSGDTSGGLGVQVAAGVRIQPGCAVACEEGAMVHFGSDQLDDCDEFIKHSMLKRLQRTLGEYTNNTEMETTVAGILMQSGLTLFSGVEEKDMYWRGLLVIAEIIVLQMRW